MHKHDIKELLDLHSQVSSLELCAMHWIPEGKSIDWYLGFLQCLEIHKGIRELFSKDMQPQAYEILAKRIRDKLLKLAADGSAQDALEEAAVAILIAMLKKGITISFILRVLASICEERELTSVSGLLESAANRLVQDEM